MAHKELIMVLSVIAAASPVSASSPEPIPAAAPAAGPDAQYCLRIEASTGTILERVRCKTRDEWASLDVDVDKEWAREGVAIVSDGVRTPASR